MAYPEHDLNMVHNVLYAPDDPRGCPPNCPYRLAVEHGTRQTKDAA